jgi:hypothetical protein
MDRLMARKVRYYVGLHYPLFVVLTDDGFCARYPDLPGCTCVARDSSDLYATMDRIRREWIAARLFAGEEIPLPNAHLESCAPVAPKVAPADASRLLETTWTPSVRALA